MPITYRKGDATAPEEAGPSVIVHVCNDAGKWGKGFVLAVSRRWSEPERTYRAAFAEPPFPQLGDVQFVPVTPAITVANMIGQHGVRSAHDRAPPPVRYPAIREGLQKVATFARSTRRLSRCLGSDANWLEEIGKRSNRSSKKRSARKVFRLAFTTFHDLP
jgi:hypothetical protein